MTQSCEEKQQCRQSKRKDVSVHHCGVALSLYAACALDLSLVRTVLLSQSFKGVIAQLPTRRFGTSSAGGARCLSLRSRSRQQNVARHLIKQARLSSRVGRGAALAVPNGRAARFDDDGRKVKGADRTQQAADHLRGASCGKTLRLLCGFVVRLLTPF